MRLLVVISMIVYYLSGQSGISASNKRGTRNQKYNFWAYPPDWEAGNFPILDGSNIRNNYATNWSLFGLDYSEWWYIKGITVRNAFQRNSDPQNRPQGFGAGIGANFIFENCVAHNISARGFWINSGAWNTWDAEDAYPNDPPYSDFAYDTTWFINCDAYDIRDSLECSAGDGWKCHVYAGNAM